jgi:UDP-N-acetylmuramate dehydrogenase
LSHVLIESDVRLAPLTTLRLGGMAKRLAMIDRESDLVEVIRDIDRERGDLLVVGGGSNLVIADEGFGGTVVRIATRGRHVAPAGALIEVTVQAGEVWDDFVGFAVAEGLSGVECLSGIPGLVGAVPMQNVGAYGQEVSETITRLRAYDRAAAKVVEIPREACGFAYRSSVFRGKDRHVILDVTFALERTTLARAVRYAELGRALGIAPGDQATPRPTLEIVRRTIIELRRKKGMVLDPDDPDTTSAGSFFTNPILVPAALADLRARLAEEERATLPVFPEPDGRSKVSAAWLIERAGFTKGFAGPGGRVAVSSKHALALTNRGGATTADLVALARQIQAGVRTRFGVTLENEPVFVGLRL